MVLVLLFGVIRTVRVIHFEGFLIDTRLFAFVSAALSIICKRALGFAGADGQTSWCVCSVYGGSGGCCQQPHLAHLLGSVVGAQLLCIQPVFPFLVRWLHACVVPVC